MFKKFKVFILNQYSFKSAIFSHFFLENYKLFRKERISLTLD